MNPIKKIIQKLMKMNKIIIMVIQTLNLQINQIKIKKNKRMHLKIKIRKEKEIEENDDKTSKAPIKYPKKYKKNY